ncbi:MAG TPA: hypothetical protein DIC44_09845 [Rikenellaceae bacterium]|nr:hypothetical protein [Rikenellaceae bacterium]
MKGLKTISIIILIAINIVCLFRINRLNKYLNTENIQILNIKTKYEEVTKKFLETSLVNSDQKNIINLYIKQSGFDSSGLCVILFSPINSCGACLTSACELLLREGINDNNIFVVNELQNTYLTKQLQSIGLTNVFDNSLVFTRALLDSILIVFVDSNNTYYIHYDPVINDMLTNFVKSVLNQGYSSS